MLSQGILLYATLTLRVDFKGALCSFGEEIQSQNFYIYNINEVIIQTIYFSHH